MRSKIIEGFPHYKVWESGRISTESGETVNHFWHQENEGYYVWLYKDLNAKEGRSMRRGDRLVLAAFNHLYRPGFKIGYKDQDPGNMAFSNLYYYTSYRHEKLLHIPSTGYQIRTGEKMMSNELLLLDFHGKLYYLTYSNKYENGVQKVEKKVRDSRRYGRKYYLFLGKKYWQDKLKILYNEL